MVTGLLILVVLLALVVLVQHSPSWRNRTDHGLADPSCKFGTKPVPDAWKGHDESKAAKARQEAEARATALRRLHAGQKPKPSNVTPISQRRAK